MDLAETVRLAGVVGAGGGGFPTHVKLAAKPDTVVINGAECEPLLGVDQELAGDYAPQLAQGLEAVLDYTGAAAGVVALKGKYGRAVAAFREAVKASPRLRLYLLDDFYPAGDEHVLVQEVTGRTVPPGGIPPEVGVTVLNVETLLNVTRAAQGEPVTEKYVTVTGAVARAATFRVPVGVSFADLVALAGGATIDPYGLIEGGPVMGRLAGDGEPVTKTTKGLIVLPPDHPAIVGRRVPLAAQLRRAASACCNCRMCTDLCPRYLLGHPLEPHRALTAVAYGLPAELGRYTSAYLCSECGLCDTVACPMGLSPRRVHAELKNRLSEAGVANPYRGQAAVPKVERMWRRIPSVRVSARLGLSTYLRPAPLVETAGHPERVRLLLRQGAGAASQALVSVGQYVQRGQVLAAPPAGKLGSLIHASIDGKVVGTAGAIEILAV